METPSSNYQKSAKIISLIHGVANGDRLSITVFKNGETDDAVNYSIGRILSERTKMCKMYVNSSPQTKDIIIENIETLNQQLRHLLGL
jgi:hypothetical protein